MHFTNLAPLLLLASEAVAVQSPHRRVPKRHKRSISKPVGGDLVKRQNSPYLNANTTQFVVNGSAIPNVNFDLGESYAGTLPIDGNSTNENRLWFWFFPSENPAASDEITIWLNGGPGCSSLDGLFQENGPFLWQSGTYEPIPNPYSWTNLTNMVWIDQPIGTGFSPAAPGAPSKIRNETDVARDFAGFWKNFMTSFDLVGRKVYIAGESYAGQYIPYIASYMLDQENTDYYNVKGIQINDPSINEDGTMIEAPSVPALNHFQSVFALNDTFMTAINQKAESCGYIDFLNNALQFPPTGPIPTAPDGDDCDVWDDIISAAIYVNPCFNVYHLTDYCPFLWDELGFPSLGIGPNNYFNQSDVQKAVNAPPTNYAICGDDTLGLRRGDSIPSALGPLPSVIERTNNTIIGHGLLDFLLFANGSLVTIQNMTWNGAQGFQQAPTEKFFTPYNPGIGAILFETENQPIPSTPQTNTAGAGYLGTTHTERGLTWVTVDLAGHEIPEYAQGAAYRQLEFLLGRIESLTQMGDFTTQTGNFTGTTNLTRRGY